MKEISLKDLALLTGSSLQQNEGMNVESNEAKVMTNVADLESATESDISFLSNPRYEGAMIKSRAGALFIHPSYKNHPHIQSSSQAFIFNEEPSRAFQLAIEYFIPHAGKLTEFIGIDPSAQIHPTAVLAPDVEVGPNTVIDAHVTVKKGTKIGALVYIGPYSEVGENCVIMPHVTLRERTLLKDRVIIQPGAVIGSCGYGYTQDAKGKHIKLNQVGRVVIEDDVEIGANTTIDRSRFKETRIGKGTKIDNLVQIAHGVTVGSDNLIISQTGIAGSSSTGNHVILAGQSALAGHIHLSDGVILAARAAASKSITQAGKYNGAPAIPLNEYNRNMVYQRKLEELFNKVKELESRFKEKE